MGNRILKESICHNQRLSLVSAFAETLFYRLIVSCDDYGNFLADPRVIKGYLFPLKENVTIDEIDVALEDLHSVGLIRFYPARGEEYLHLPGWEEHQKLKYRTAMYPLPGEEIECRARYS